VEAFSTGHEHILTPYGRFRRPKATASAIIEAAPFPASLPIWVVYAVSVTAFGGTTPYAVTWLIKITGNPLTPVWYWTVAIIAAMCAIRESVPRKVAKPQPLAIQLADEMAD
jgi:hypothetical protein